MCAGDTLTLNASTQNGNYTWELNGAVIPGEALGQLLTKAPGGQYIATVTVPGCGTYQGYGEYHLFHISLHLLFPWVRIHYYVRKKYFRLQPV